jgi:hypothetical protein
MILILQDAFNPKEFLAVDHGTSARCFTMYFSAGFLGLGRPTAFALLSSSLQLPEVLRPSLGDHIPTLPSKLDGDGIFLSWHNSEDVALAPGLLCMTDAVQPKSSKSSKSSLNCAY